MNEKTYSRIVFYSTLIFVPVIFCCIILGGQPSVSSSFVNTKEKFNCSNGVSIETSEVCDGRKDCSDSSDETVALCARNEYRNNFSTDCGRVYINQETIVNGQNATVGTAPWHAGIYRFVKNVYNHEFLCGGSIISSNLVVTGARCFWYHRGMSSNIITNINGLYKIAVGKYDRNFSVIDNNFTQIMDVENIYLEKGGFFEFLANNIAIVVLKNRVSFSYYIVPVCVDWDEKYNVVNGDQGKIVGWGYPNNGSISPILSELSLPYINLSTCRKMYPNVSRVVLTFDKFCTASELGPDVSVGYDGDGLSFFHNNSYYLTGVTGIKDPLSSLTVFTEVKYHIQWIRGLYNKHK
ncbi:serine protease 48-like [Metopolophium dirhodum]|uniref:serine protease 48-like n=1 Tax=Metopolophium dirhodum TaxID=44670 RepID=UPI00298F592A|nr:serine protease 48-like [Metopolophium dirhodum]